MKNKSHSLFVLVDIAAIKIIANLTTVVMAIEQDNFVVNVQRVCVSRF